jgi:hypothetical protein
VKSVIDGIESVGMLASHPAALRRDQLDVDLMGQAGGDLVLHSRRGAGLSPARTAGQSPIRVGQYRRATLPRSCSAAYAVAGKFSRLRRDVDPVQAGRVLTQDLAFDLKGQIDVVFLF